MEREKRIHYIDNFKFSFILPLSESVRYEIIVKTIGLNEFTASFEHKHHHGWVGKNCQIYGDEVTVFVKDHKLPPGKVYCHIKMFDRHDHQSDCLGIDPHIILTYDHLSTPAAPSDVDAQQSIDIINLYDRVHKIKGDVKGLEKAVENKSAVIDIYGRIIPELYVTEDDENDPLIYTKEQADERFATKNELGNLNLEGYYTKSEIDALVSQVDISNQLTDYEKTETVDKKLEDKADKKYLNSNFYNKSEADNRFLTSHQDLSDYLTFTEMSKKLSQYQLAGDYLVHSDLGDYYNREEINSLIDEVDVRADLKDYALIQETTKVRDNYGVVTEMMVDLTENDFTDTFYTKQQTNDRFAIKEETVTIDKLDPYVKLDYLSDYYYSKAESNNIFLTHNDCYTKEAVDALLRQVYKAMGELDSKFSNA